LQSEIESVPGRVRRLLRQRADKDIPAAAQLDASEVDEIVALIDFVAVCRTYAGELAINEVTLRTFSDLQHYVEQSTEALVQSLRASEGKNRAYRQLQVAAAIRFCNVLFGPDYASLMNRAAENAMTGERKSSRAG
jgi:maltooligosyltrehalose synthase